MTVFQENAVLLLSDSNWHYLFNMSLGLIILVNDKDAAISNDHI